MAGMSIIEAFTLTIYLKDLRIKDLRISDNMKFYPNALYKVRQYLEKEIELSKEEYETAGHLTSEDNHIVAEIGSRLNTLQEVLAVVIKEGWEDRRREDLAPLRK